MKILLLGYRSIGRHLVRLLDHDFTAMVRDIAAHRERGTLGVRLMTEDSFDQAVADADLVVEAAGVAAAKRFLPRVHKPFVLTSDRKSTRLNSSHVAISYAVFCLKKKISYAR